MSEQKTVIIWDQCGEVAITFYVLDGDLRHLDGVYLNVENDGSESAADELDALLETEITKDKALDEFPTTAVLEGAFVIVCGFVP